jgi:stress response protein SCP2
VNTTDAVLLRRHAQVFPKAEGIASDVSNLVSALEVELIALGFVISPALRDALLACNETQLRDWHAWLPTELSKNLGAHRVHTPLFRHFPNGVPEDTWQLYVERVITFLAQQPNQPCVLCGSVGTVMALDPCGHLVCSRCWDGSNYSGCPICHRHINPDQAFLKPTPAREALNTDGLTLTRLDLGTDRNNTARDTLLSLLSRLTPLSPQDRLDLNTLLEEFGTQALTWLPERIPVKETMALTFAALLRGQHAFDDHADVLAAHLRTATDVLRVIIGWMGLDVSLAPVAGQTRRWLKSFQDNPNLQTEHGRRYLQQLSGQYFPRLKSMPRAMRKHVLAALERLELHALIEDLQRHDLRWKHIAELLHVFEYHRRFPKVALAFAILRETQVGTLKPELRASLESVATVQTPLEAGEYRYRPWASQLEAALREHQPANALRLLEQRPGEFGRRFDHLLREINARQPDLLEAFTVAFHERIAKLTTPMLLTLLAHLSSRARPVRKRVFFPKGEALYSYATPDARATLPIAQLEVFTNLIEHELLRRAEAKSAFSSAVIDHDLQNVFVPFSERNASPSKVLVPRGSVLEIPKNQRLRLFMHWMQDERQRVDLDLSVAFYDERWRFVDQCDFTKLQSSTGDFVHSGDYTDAPAPHGASEFIDLDVRRLRERGIRYAMMIVFSYNSVPFDRMPFAFAGIMERHDNTGEIFEARTVKHKFDLQGNAQIAIPMVVNLAQHNMRWLDVKLGANDLYHQVGGYHKRLASLGADMNAHFDSGARTTLWQLACLHASARTTRVIVRRKNNNVLEFQRGEHESVHGFYRRVLRLERPDGEHVFVPNLDSPAFVALLRCDLKLPDLSAGYALDWTDAGVNATRLTASDLLVI